MVVVGGAFMVGGVSVSDDMGGISTGDEVIFTSTPELAHCGGGGWGVGWDSTLAQMFGSTSFLRNSIVGPCQLIWCTFTGFCIVGFPERIFIFRQNVQSAGGGA